MAITESGRIVLDYLDKYPDMKTKTLARKVFKETEGMWTSIEVVRDRIRYYRKQHGDHDRKAISPEHIRHAAENGDKRRGKPKSVAIPAKCNILIFDIETSPMFALPWGCLKQFINPEQLLAPSLVMCWAAKWLGQKTMHFKRMDIPQGSLPDDPIEALMALAGFYKHSDYDVCEAIWQLFDRADIVVAHNGKAFDTSILRTRWLDHGLPPPSPYKIVDTLWTARKQFRFPRNKLESIAIYRKIGQKIEHEGFPLWKKCMCGDRDALRRMKKYNIGDTDLLEEVYMDFRPWMVNHPNVALCYEDGVRRCTACGGTVLNLLPTPAKTAASVFDAYRCESCGKVLRSRKRHDPVGDIEDRMANVRG